MFIYLTYKYRIYPTENQISKIESTFSAISLLYNFALNEMIAQHQHNANILDLSLDNYLREPHLSLCNIDPFVLTQTLDRLHQDFLKAVKRNEYPKQLSTKQIHSYRASTKGNKTHISNNNVFIPYIGDVKIVVHRELPSSPLNATIIKDTTGAYYIAFLIKRCVPYQDFATATYDNSIALDYSNPKFYVDSNGNSPNHPRFYKEEEERLEKEIAKLKRKKKGSSNYNKQLRKVNKLRAKITNRRKDWLHKESKRLADTYEYVGVEDLDIKGIMHTYKLYTNAQDNAYGMFVNMLQYKLAAQGKLLFKVNRWLRTSQSCNHCGYINKELTLGDRFWKCSRCGKTNARDHNAALNILDEIIKYKG